MTAVGRAAQAGWLVALAAACAGPSPTRPAGSGAAPAALQPTTGLSSTPRMLPLFPTDTPIPGPTTPAPPTPGPTTTPGPTVSPTFGPRISRTPAPPGACPTVQAGLTFEAPVLEDTGEALQQVYDFLNDGGSVQALARGLEQAWATGDDYYQLRALRGERGYARSAHMVEDLTGDGVADTLLFLAHGSSFIIELLRCTDGQYAVAYLESWPPDEFAIPQEFSVRDVNGNGTNELLFEVFGGHGAYHFEGVDVYEWNGSTLVRVLETPGFNVAVNVEILDVDGDGAGEFRVTLGPPYECASDPPSWLPYRNEIYTLGWNGAEYVEIGYELAAPEYRFQMVYAADEAAAQGEYEQAMVYYQAAIFDVSLKPASADLWTFLAENCTRLGMGTPAPAPTPLPLAQPSLEGYSRYRLLLTHVLRGDLASAGVVYAELQRRFPEGAAGHAYVELAAAFWDEYERSGESGAACGQARQYAQEHPAEILAPLGTDFYGLAGQDYQPEDICPVS